MSELKEQAAISPVAEDNKFKSIGAKVAVGLLAAIALYGIFKSDDKPKQKQDVKTEKADVANQRAPQMVLSPAQQTRLAENVAQLDKGVKPEQAAEAEKLARLRETAPTLVYSDDKSSDSIDKSKTSSSSGGSKFLDSMSQTSAPTVKARQLKHLESLLAQGNIIAATLETRIASDLPGMVRAVTSNDIYGEDNSKILLPKGSRLIGEYSSGIAQGQNRVFVIWQRLIRPDGIDIQLNSPGTDALGTAGLAADAMDRHFIQQFGSAILLSIIGAGAANVGVKSTDNLNSASSYRAAMANSFSQTAQTSLQAGNIKPTLYINQGNKINVFVARDLDFDGVLP